MVNKSYINKITEDIIKDEDFIPLRDEYGRFIINDFYRVLERLDVNSYTLLSMFDCDKLDITSIEKALYKSISYAKAYSTNHSDEIEQLFILINNNELSIQKKQFLHSFMENTSWKDQTTVFFIDLSSKEINIAGGGNSTDSISYFVKKNVNILDNFDDINQNIDSISIGEFKKPTIVEAATNTRVLWVIIGLNILVWAIGNIILYRTGTDVLKAFGIKSTVLIIAGEYWRLVTPMFLHADFAHLMANTFTLFIFGQAVERMLGPHRFLIVYLVAGIMGNILSFAFTPNNSLGASGAVLGLGGVILFIGFVSKGVFPIERRRYLTLVFIVVFNVLYGFGNTGIDNFAHIGGILGGLMTSAIIARKSWDIKAGKRLAYLIALVFISMIGIAKGFSMGYKYFN